MIEGIKRVATICVLKHKTSFLLLKRLKDPHKDAYTPLGGKIDPYESPLAGAIRETYEEAGIVLQSMDFCGILTETSPTKYNWISYVYLAEIENINPPECNEGTLEWINFEDLLQVPTPKTDWFIYDYLLKNQKFVFNAEYDKNLDLITMTDELSQIKLI